MTLKEIVETHSNLCDSVLAYAKEKLAGTDFENPKVIDYEYREGVFEYNIKYVFLDNGYVYFSYEDGDEDEEIEFDMLPLFRQIHILDLL